MRRRETAQVVNDKITKTPGSFCVVKVCNIGQFCLFFCPKTRFAQVKYLWFLMWSVIMPSVGNCSTLGQLSRQEISCYELYIFQPSITMMLSYLNYSREFMNALRLQSAGEMKRTGSVQYFTID